MLNKSISKIINKENWPYFIFGLAVAIYIIFENGWWYFFNYSSMLIGLFVPALILADLFIYVRKLVLKQPAEYGNFLLHLIQVALIIIAFLFGLEKMQRLTILLYGGVICSVLLVIMFFLSFKKQAKS